MKYIFYAMILVSVLFTAYQQLFVWVPVSDVEQAAQIAAAAAAGAPTPTFPSPMDNLTAGAMDQAKKAVEIALGLVGGMTFFLGLMKVAEAGGLMTVLAKLIRPLMVRLFPEVPPNHPAMGAMILNIAANALGLGNAATPFGIRAMQELDRLNPHKGTATNAMALFLAINTSAVTLLPTGVIVQRQILGSSNPAAIFATTLIATTASTTAAILSVLLFQRLVAPAAVVHERAVAGGDVGVAEAKADVAVDGSLTDTSAYPAWVSFAFLASLLVFIGLLIPFGKVISPWVVPALIAGLLTFGFARGVDVYATLVQGAKSGFEVATTIIPYLVAILVAVGMLRASGVLGAFTSLVGPYTSLVGLPAEALPMALLRPLSGSGASGVMLDTMKTAGPDSYVGLLVGTIQGSTETTFYVLAVYYGAIGVKRIRHTLPAALCADFFGIAGSIAAVWFLYGRDGL